MALLCVYIFSTIKLLNVHKTNYMRGKIVFNDTARMAEVNWTIKLYQSVEFISRETMWASLTSMSLEVKR